MLGRHCIAVFAPMTRDTRHGCFAVGWGN
uniref:Putative AraD-like aldolase/epimerase n=1 Tax=mine drainage metagenome TaxID=410659 RepID=E6QJV1_9ZZZZ